MLTTVTPLYNEADSLIELHRQLVLMGQERDDTLQMIFVDDGSTDGSWEKIMEIAADDSRVLGIRLRRNFGKAAALAAGFEATEGDVVVTLDADLQDDPAEIPKLLAKLAEGFDVVSGWKRVRHDPWHKTLPSRVFNWLVSRTTGVRLHDHNCGIKAFRRAVIHEIRLYGELHRFVPVLAAARGFRVTEIAVQHRARQFGSSKYGVERLAKGFLDLLTVKFITGFGYRPQHVLGMTGLAAFLLGGLALGYLAIVWCASRLLAGWEPIHLHQTAALYYAIGLWLVGAQFLSVGLLGEMITAFLARDVDAFSVAEHTAPVARHGTLSPAPTGDLR